VTKAKLQLHETLLTGHDGEVGKTIATAVRKTWIVAPLHWG